MAPRDLGSGRGGHGGDQVARRDLGSGRVVGYRGPGGPAGLRLRARGRGGRPASTVGLSLRTLGCEARRGSSAVLRLLARGCGGRPSGLEGLRSEAFPHPGARLDWGAGPVPSPRRLPPLPDASWVAFCRRRRRLRGYRGGDGRGGGSSLWSGGARPPSRRRLRGNSVACQSPGRRGPRAQGLLSQSPYRCRGRAVEAGSSEADVVCRDGTGAPAGRRVSLAAGRSGLVPLTLATVVGRHLAAVCISFVPSGATRDAIWPRRTCWTSSRPAVLAGSCRWRRRVGARPLGPRLHLQDY